MTAGDPASWDALPLTILVPEDASGCVGVYDQHAALKIDVVERDRAYLVGDEWDFWAVGTASGTWPLSELRERAARC